MLWYTLLTSSKPFVPPWIFFKIVSNTNELVHDYEDDNIHKVESNTFFICGPQCFKKFESNFNSSWVYWSLKLFLVFCNCFSQILIFWFNCLIPCSFNSSNMHNINFFANILWWQVFIFSFHLWVHSQLGHP